VLQINLKVAPETDLRDKGGLINDISEIYQLLNGQTNDGQSARYGSLFKITRYAIVLLAAATLENFKDQTMVIKGSPFFNFYRLEKVADFLHLEYDRTKQAKKIYEELESRGEVTREVTKDNKTYISLTENGVNKCLKKIQELRNLKDYFVRIPPLQQNYTQDWLARKSSEDLLSKSYEMTSDEANVEKLIKSISLWD
jgi:ATP-dependent Lon protease